MPGDFILVDQYIDRTVQRVNSFFPMAVWALAHPVCANLNERVLEAAEQSNVSVFAGGTYVAIVSSIFLASGVQSLSFVGLRCDWDDQYARGETIRTGCVTARWRW